MSDLHKLFGLDSSESIHALLKYKRKEKERQYDDFVLYCFDFGHAMEEASLHYMSLIGLNCTQIPMIVKDDVGGTVDGLTNHPIYGQCVVEIKWRVWPSPENAKLGPLKEKHYVQLAGYLGLLDIEYGILMECTLSDGVRITVFRRDDLFWKEASNRMQEFLRVWRSGASFPRLPAGSKQRDKIFVHESCERSFVEQTVNSTWL